MIKRRLRRGIRATVENGGYIANAPYGYDKARVGKAPSLVPNEAEAAFVRQMFELYANGMGCQRIADTINALGAVPRRGQQFNRTTVRTILKNPVYIGKVVWNRKTHVRPGRQNEKHAVIYHPKEEWTVVEGLHPAIVPLELFDRVQEIFAGRYHSPSFTGVIENPLAGLIICGNCGHTMQRQADKRGGPMLLCQKHGCIVSSKLNLVEERLIARMKEELSLLVQSQGEAPTQEDHTAQTRQALEKQISTARAQDEKLHDLLEQGIYDTETFLSRHQALSQRIQSLEAAKSHLHAPKQLDIPQMTQRLQNLFDCYQGLPAGERNQLLKTVIEKAVYYKEKGAKPAEFRLDVFLVPIYL